MAAGSEALRAPASQAKIPRPREHLEHVVSGRGHLWRRLAVNDSRRQTGKLLLLAQLMHGIEGVSVGLVVPKVDQTPEPMPQCDALHGSPSRRPSRSAQLYDLPPGKAPQLSRFGRLPQRLVQRPACDGRVPRPSHMERDRRPLALDGDAERRKNRRQPVCQRSYLSLCAA